MAAKTELSDSRKNSNQYSTDVPSSVKKKIKCSNGLKMFMIALSFSYICKSLAGTVMKSSITHIERRFGTTSSEAGLIDGSFEMGNLMFLTLVSHFGSKSHIPRIIGTGCFIMGIGSILTCSPHFFMGYYRYDSALTVKPLENSTGIYTPCSTDLNLTGYSESSALLKSGCKNESGLPMWIYVLMGNMLRGIGETPITPLGITYIDNFAEEGHSTFYIGILHSLSMFGPLFGFLLGSLCAKLYVDIGYVDLNTITIKPTDSRWVGAWWLGFLIMGILSIAAGIPFFFIPKSLEKPTKERKISASLNIASTNESRSQRTNFKNPEQKKESKNLAGFFHSLKRILSNWMYIIYLIHSLFSFSSFIGYVTFMTKFLEQYFGQSISKLNFFIGIIIMPVISISIFLGGFISRKLKLKTLGIIKLLFISYICATAFQVLLLSFNCERRSVAGLTVTYDGNNLRTHPQNTSFPFCNSECNCDANLWDPVCGDNGITYMSPCLAGCKSSVGHGNDLVFHNCSCIEVHNFQSSTTSAHLGQCSMSDDCSRNFIYFMAVQALSSFFVGLGGPSKMVLTFKNVEPELKSLAVAIHLLILRTLGGILAPIYFGAAIDSSCLKWATNNCGGKGACRIYDSISYRNIFFSLCVGLNVPSIILLIILYMVMKKKYGKNNTGQSSNGEIDVDESNLREPLKNNKQFITSVHEDSETHI
ncbi:solute carrier organic anion transporter family member 1B1-like isoform X1 [Sarcophilus harrisii]|uniref:Solute carrier organic anion transporter family member n=4 Tax=Sarcophilus harrisii TaxID=9305 RepID=G3WV28_SARHA|nr:solute carrier organic anion transporter family member 1B1-like isoform X1 [Sarcophilus harrisii]